MTGFLNVILAIRVISKLASLTSGSVTVKRSWPERRAPDEFAVFP